MNEYQKALKTLSDISITYDYGKEPDKVGKLYKDEVELLETLVYRATKIKPLDIVEIENGYVGDCKCSNAVYWPSSFCDECGQALDWSDKNE